MPMEVCTAEFWAEEPVAARAYPLKNAEAVLDVEPNRAYVAEAVCNGYYRVTVGEEAAYVPVRSVRTLRRGQDTARAAVISPETELFTAPESVAVSDRRVAQAQLFLLGRWRTASSRWRACRGPISGPTT